MCTRNWRDVEKILLNESFLYFHVPHFTFLKEREELMEVKWNQLCSLGGVLSLHPMHGMFLFGFKNGKCR